MFFDGMLPMADPVVIDPTVGKLALEAEKVAPSPPSPPPSPEQLRAVEEYFSAQQESEAVAGLLGLWTATMLLHDLAVETFAKPAGEFDEEEQRREERKRRQKGHP